jgi:hypothetical protein
VSGKTISRSEMLEPSECPRETGGDEATTLGQKHAHDACAVSPQGHANADLGNALADRAGDESVETESRQAQRGDREAAERAARHPPIPRVGRDQAFHGGDVGQGYVPVCIPYTGAQDLPQGTRIAARVDDEEEPELRALRVRHVHLGSGRLVQLPVMDVADDADDLAP